MKTYADIEEYILSDIAPYYYYVWVVISDFKSILLSEDEEKPTYGINGWTGINLFEHFEQPFLNEDFISPPSSLIFLCKGGEICW